MRYLLSHVGFQAWKMFVSTFEPPSDGLFSSIVVATPELVRTSWLLEAAVGAGRSCLLVGSPGTGKTLCLKKYLANQDLAGHTQLSMSLSSRSTSLDIQQAIEVC